MRLSTLLLILPFGGCFDAALPDTLALACVRDADCFDGRVCGPAGLCVADAEPPALVLGNPVPLIASRGDVRVLVDVAGADEVVVALADLDTGPRFTETGPGEWSLAADDLDEGSFAIVARARDATGNVTTATADLPLVVDHTPPQLLGGFVDPSPAAPGENILLTLSFDEPVLTPEAEAEATSTFFIPLFDEGDFHVLEALAPAVDGPLAVTVSNLRDLAGNAIDDVVIDAAVDARAPALTEALLRDGDGNLVQPTTESIEGTPIVDGLNRTSTLVVTVAFDEPADTVAVAVAGLAMAPDSTAPAGTIRFIRALADITFDGLADVVVTASDDKGNESSTVARQVRIDTVEPEVIGVATPLEPIPAEQTGAVQITLTEAVRLVGADVDAPLVPLPTESLSPIVTIGAAVPLDLAGSPTVPALRSITVVDGLGNEVTRSAAAVVTFDPSTCGEGLHDDGTGLCAPLDECAPGFFLDAFECTFPDHLFTPEFGLIGTPRTLPDGSPAIETTGPLVLSGARFGPEDCDAVVGIQADVVFVDTWDGEAVLPDPCPQGCSFAAHGIGPDGISVRVGSTIRFTATFSTNEDAGQSFPLPAGTAAFPAFEGAREVLFSDTGVPFVRHRIALRIRHASPSALVGDDIPLEIQLNRNGKNVARARLFVEQVAVRLFRPNTGVLLGCNQP